MTPPEIALGPALALAAWAGVAICGGWIALAGGLMKRRFGWRYFPTTMCSLRIAIVLSAASLTAMFGLLALMLWRSQSLPFHSLAEGIAFVCYFFAPMLCLLLSIALSRGEGASCK